MLGGYGVACSLLGVQTQHCDRGGAIHFLDRLLPATPVTFAIPLLDMNVIQRTTPIWLGWHHDSDVMVIPTSAEKGEEPFVQEGPCALWDWRVSPHAEPRRDAAPAPFMTYCPPCRLVHLNYQKQPLSYAPRHCLSTLSGENLYLAAWATARWLPETSTSKPGALPH